MEFCTEIIYREDNETIDEYAFRKHSFSYIYVYFYSDLGQYNRIDLYPCNFDVFLTKLMDWGVIPHQDIEEYVKRFEVSHNLPKFNLKMRK